MAPEDPTPDVMSSLPRTRPQRRSTKRAARPAAGTGTPAKPPAARKPAGAGKPAAAKRAPAAKARRPKVTAAATPRIPPAGFAPPADAEGRPVPTGVELVGTAIQAAGELAQIGLAVGGQALKSALGRLGRP